MYELVDQGFKQMVNLNHTSSISLEMNKKLKLRCPVHNMKYEVNNLKLQKFKNRYQYCIEIFFV